MSVYQRPSHFHLMWDSYCQWSPFPPFIHELSHHVSSDCFQQCGVRRIAKWDILNQQQTLWHTYEGAFFPN